MNVLGMYLPKGIGLANFLKLVSLENDKHCLLTKPQQNLRMRYIATCEGPIFFPSIRNGLYFITFLHAATLLLRKENTWNTQPYHLNLLEPSDVLFACLNLNKKKLGQKSISYFLVDIEVKLKRFDKKLFGSLSQMLVLTNKINRKIFVNPNSYYRKETG